MEKKNQKSARGRIKDIYGNEVPSDISFAEYWDRQHLIEKYSYEESVRQKQERLRKEMTKVCPICGNEEHCVCDELDSIRKAISKGLFNTPKCNNHTELKQENGECCQEKNKKK